MKIELEFKKRHFFMLGLLIIAIYSFNFVIAATGSTPLNPGHPLSEIWIDTDLNMQGKTISNVGGGFGGGVPTGGIIMWSGSYNNIPSGWALADGSSGRPDLRSKFIYGVNTAYGMGNNGNINTVGGSTSTLIDTVGTSVNFAGGVQVAKLGHAHTFMPPYYVLAFIIKL